MQGVGKLTKHKERRKPSPAQCANHDWARQPPNDLIPIDEPTTEKREGFNVYAVKLMLPKDMAALDPATRRELMICDLFLTEKLTISEIVGVLDGEDQKSVILTLIKRGVLKDRREQQKPCTIDRRVRR